MYPYNFYYRIIKKDDVFNVFIDNLNHNIDVLTIKNEVLKKINDIIDVNQEEIKYKLFIAGHLASGANELVDRPLDYAEEKSDELGKKDILYQLVGDINSSKQMLRIYYNNSVVSIINYSIKEESLGVKLNSRSEEANQLVDNEEYTTEQSKSNNTSDKEDIMLPPVLSGDKLMCQHGGEVIFTSIDGKPFCNDSDTVVLDSDLINAKIVGCQNNILGFPKPCTSIILMPPNALSKESFNGKKAIIRDYLSNILTDNMVGLVMKQPVEPNLWEVSSYPPKTNDGGVDSILLELKPGIFCIVYDNISSDKVCIFNTTFENMSKATYIKTLSIKTLSKDNPLEIIFDNPEQNDETIDSKVLNMLEKNIQGDLIYKVLTVIYDNNICEYILLIPKAKNSILRKIPKEYREYGYGSIIGLPYTTLRTVTNSNNKHNVGYANIKTESFRFPAGTKKFLLHIDAFSSLVSKGNVKNIIHSNKQLVNFYSSSVDFSNRYSHLLSFYHVIFKSDEYRHSYEYIRKLIDKASKNNLSIESNSSNKETIENIVYDAEEEKKSLVNLIYTILSSDNIDSILDESIRLYNKFLTILMDKEYSSSNTSEQNSNKNGDYYGGVKLKSLVNILQNAESSRYKIYSKREEYKQELKDLSKFLVWKLIIRKLIEIIRDNIIPFHEADKTKEFIPTIHNSMKKYKLLSSMMPDSIMLIFDIIFLIIDIVREYIDGPKLMEEFCNVLSFYSNLDSDLSTIIKSNSINSSVFYKTKLDKKYQLSLYSINQYNYESLKFFKNNDLQTPCNYVRVYIDDNAFNHYDISVEQIIDERTLCVNGSVNNGGEGAITSAKIVRNPNNTEVDNIITNSVNGIAQLSLFNSLDNLKESSYFHHVKDLILKANALTFIESSSFSSIFISELIKQSFYTPLEEQINKSVIIVTDGIEKHSLVYKSQNFVFSNILTDKKCPNIYSFRLMREYKISELSKHIISQLEEIYDILTTYFRDINIDYDAKALQDNEEYNIMLEFVEAFVNIYKDVLYIRAVKNKKDKILYKFDMNKDKFLKFFNINKVKVTDEDKEENNELEHDAEQLKSDLGAKVQAKLQAPVHTEEDSKEKQEEYKYVLSNDNLIHYMQSVCNKFSDTISKINDKKSEYISILYKYKDYNFSIFRGLNNIKNAINSLNSLIELQYNILGYFHEEVNDKELKDKIDTTISLLHDSMDDFFAKTTHYGFQIRTQNDNEPISSELIEYIRSDNSLRDICKNIVSSEYSYEYTENSSKLKLLIEMYHKSTYDYPGAINKLDDYINKLYDLYSNIAKIINKSIYEEHENDTRILCIVEHDVYSLDKNFFKKLFRSGVYIHLDNVLPVRKGSIEYAVDEPKYYSMLLESIFVKFLLSLQSKSTDDNVANNRAIAYLCGYIFHRAINYMLFEYGIDDNEMLECAKIIRISNILLSKGYIKEEKLNTVNADDVKPGPAIKTTNRTIMKTIDAQINNIKKKTDIVVTNPLDNPDENIKKLLLGLTNNAKTNKNLDKNISNVIMYTTNAINDLNSIIDIVNGKSSIFEFNFTTLSTFMVKSTDITKYKEHIDKVAEQYVDAFTTDNIKNAIDSIISLDNISDYVFKEMEALYNGFIKDIKQMGVNFLCDLIIETFFRVPELEEYEAKTNAIKYAYTSKRMDSRGALYVPKRDMLALPVKITQNYIMSDFRAAVFGGASFDNDCFVRGTSTGIFIQDDSVIPQNFIDKLCEYVYNIPLNEINIKDAIYIEAYKKLIIYMHSYNNNISKVIALYKNLMDGEALGNIGEPTVEPSMLKNNNNYNINTHNGKYFKKEYIDDFVKQLKLFGEYNYKYFYAHEELLSDDSADSDELDNNNSDPVDTVLLGSLVYDNKWIDNKI